MFGAGFSVVKLPASRSISGTETRFGVVDGRLLLESWSGGIMRSQKNLITNADISLIGGATAIEIGYDSVAHKDYLGFHYDNGNITVISFTETGIQCDVLEGAQWHTKWRK